MTNNQLKRAQEICEENKRLERLLKFMNNGLHKPVDPMFAQFLPAAVIACFEKAVRIQLNKRLSANIDEFEAL